MKLFASSLLLWHGAAILRLQLREQLQEDLLPFGVRSVHPKALRRHRHEGLIQVRHDHGTEAARLRGHVEGHRLVEGHQVDVPLQGVGRLAKRTQEGDSIST